RPPTPRSPLFPYTTLFRSHPPCPDEQQRPEDRDRRVVERRPRELARMPRNATGIGRKDEQDRDERNPDHGGPADHFVPPSEVPLDRKSTRLNSSHLGISYA